MGFLKGSKLKDVVSEWKLRAAYGEAGIQPGAYDRFPILTTTALGAQSAFSTPVANANADLQIEVSKELEFGTDLTLKLGSKEWLNNLNIGFTVWNRTSENVIDQVDVAPSLGIGRQLTNSMTLKSNGIQASLNLVVLTSKDWEWDFTTNFNKQVSKVDKVLGGAELNAFHLLNGGSSASQPFEPSAWPKPLLAEQESAECDAGNCIHKKITEDISPRSPFVVESIYLVIAQ